MQTLLTRLAMAAAINLGIFLLPVAASLARPSDPATAEPDHSLPLATLAIAAGTIGLGGLVWLSRREQFYRTLFTQTQAPTLLVEAETHRIRQANAAIAQLLGYTPTALKQLTLSAIEAAPDPALPENPLSLDRHHPENGQEKVYRHQQGHSILVETYTQRIERGTSSWLCITVQDITAQRQRERQLEYQATHDTLTGLPNRALLVTALQQAILTQQNARFAILFIDLDEFKLINDSIGHSAADELLIALTRSLQTCLAPGQILARLGGDEFVIFMPQAPALKEVTQLAQHLLIIFQDPIEINGQRVRMSASIGIAIRDQASLSSQYSTSKSHLEPLEELLREADIAMYKAKRKGRSQYSIFDSKMHKQVADRMQLEADLREAVDHQKLQVHYQPIVLLATSQIIGFEALARWQHPDLGMIPPVKFIPIAEETGLIISIDQWVLREACRQLSQWHQQFPTSPQLSISVNLSGVEFSGSDLVKQIAQIQADFRIPKNCLKLELTEGLITMDNQSVISTLTQLRELGIELSIDDFGIGYSSLSRLENYPINTLKIDRCFISKMGKNGENSATVKMIITLAHSLGMNVVAEGLETLDHLHRVILMKCDFGQGFFFSKPLDPAGVERLLQDPLAIAKLRK